jgi:hypothetical protein
MTKIQGPFCPTKHSKKHELGQAQSQVVAIKILLLNSTHSNEELLVHHFW